MKSARPTEAESSATENGASIVHDSFELAKLEATLIAQITLSGHEVYRLATGGFLVARWNFSRHCADLAELKAFARQLGVHP